MDLHKNPQSGDYQVSEYYKLFYDNFAYLDWSVRSHRSRKLTNSQSLTHSISATIISGI